MAQQASGLAANALLDAPAQSPHQYPRYHGPRFEHGMERLYEVIQHRKRGKGE